MRLLIADPAAVREGRGPAREAEGVRDVRAAAVGGGAFTLLAVGSGTYRFSGPLAARG